MKCDIRKKQDELLSTKQFSWNPDTYRGVINLRPCGVKLWRKDSPYLIWRCGSLEAISPDEYEKLIHNLDVSSHISLLSSVEKANSNFKTSIPFLKQVNFPFGSLDNNFRQIHTPTVTNYIDLYWQYITQNIQEIVKIFQFIAAVKHPSILINCHAGKDRTGVICLLLLGLIGFQETAITEDYMLSADPLSQQLDFFVKHWQKRNISRTAYAARMRCQAEIPQQIINNIKKYYGSFNSYFLSIGLKNETIQGIKQRYAKHLEQSYV